MSNLFSRIRNKTRQYFEALVRAIISLHKRDGHLIVYGGALDLFIDNAKHLFIVNNQTMPQYRHVWLTKSNELLIKVRSLGFEAELSDSKRGRYILYRAGMVIYDNRIDEFASHNLASGAIKFELWHGITVAKRIGSINSDPPKPYVVTSTFKDRYFNSHIYGDYVLATSSSLSATMSAAFQVPVEKVIVADQPRNYILYLKGEKLEQYVKYEDDNGKKVLNELKEESRQKVIYMPTFRDADPQYIYKAIPDWEGFNRFLKDNNIVFYLKVHRVTPLPKDLNYDNIRVLDNSLDIYPLLPLFDRLITDYSSVMFDYAILRKPIIIYDYDLEEYASESRCVFKSFYMLLKEITEVKNYDQLVSIMAEENTSIKPFPIENYYDCPGDYSGITNFIINKLSEVFGE